MDERYCRNIPALTPREQALLRDRRVLIAGCGGLGGYLLEFMLRLGVGEIVVVDGDVFEPSNLNRQLLSETTLLGTGKAEAAAGRARRVNPEVRVRAVHAFLDEGNAGELVGGCHAALDALDNVAGRRVLADACGRAGVPYVYGAVSGWVAQAAVVMPGDGLLDLLYRDGAAPSDRGALSFTPALCAAVQASLCVRLLCGRPVQAGTLHCFDLLHLEAEGIPLA